MLTAVKRELTMLAMSVALVVLAGCGSSGLATPTPTPSRLGPAMVQIENSILARPQAGLQQADVVYEYLAEGGITRMTVIYFKPSGSQRIEPFRSARPVTIRLWHAYHGVIFYSGANVHVLQQIQSQNIPAVTEGTDGDRLAQGLKKYAPRITYQLPSTGTPTASPAPAVANRVVFSQTNAHRVTYTYSASDGGYAYGTETGPLIDKNTGQPIKPVNVILIQVGHHDAGFTDVLGAPAVDFDLQGTGPADVFTQGHRYTATWDLTNAELPLKILGSDGKVMHLPAGLTWIHLVDPGTPITVS